MKNILLIESGTENTRGYVLAAIAHGEFPIVLVGKEAPVIPPSNNRV